MGNRILIMLCMMTSSVVLSQTPWKECSTSMYELSFYESEASSFKNARSTCQNIGADLIQLDDIDVRNKFYEITSQFTDKRFCWIGATGTLYNWYWLSGIIVDMDSITWNTNQPDNNKNIENRMIYLSRLNTFGDVSWDYNIGVPTCQKKRVITSGITTLTFYRFTEDGSSYARNYDSAQTSCYSQQSRLVVLTETNKATISTSIKYRPDDIYWVDGKTGSRCSARKGTGDINTHCFDSYYYVCEQVQTNYIYLTTNSLEIGSQSTTTITCAASGYPYPYVKWTRNKNEVSTSARNSVYQINTSGRSVLQLEKAKVTDEEQYTCVATNSYGGSTFSRSKQSRVAVPSTPTINTATTSSCNSSLVIEWKPHHRAIEVKHRIIMYESGSKVDIEFYVTPADDKMQYTTIRNLSSSTQYTVTIEPCSNTGNCYLYVASSTSTTVDIPNPVTNAVMKNSSGQCIVSWSFPRVTRPSYIIVFKLLVTSSFAQSPADGNATIHKYNTLVGSSVLSYIIPTLPNRNYSVSILTETCAGVGQYTVAAGTCITELRAPSFLAQPQTNSYISDNGTLEITIQTPDESNGQIICVFVLVQVIDVNKNSSKPVFDKEYLKSLNSASLKDEYIAIAVDRQRMKPKKTIFILGDNSFTGCKLEAKNESDRKKRVTTEVFYVGTNKLLNKDLSYNIYTVTATPSETQMYFKTSDALKLKSNIESTTNETKENTTQIISSSVAGVVFFVLLVLVIVLMRRKCRSIIPKGNTSSDNTNEEHGHSHVYEHPTMRTGQQGVDNTLNVPPKKIHESTYHYCITPRSHENAVNVNQESNAQYEIASPYEIISS